MLKIFFVLFFFSYHLFSEDFEGKYKLNLNQSEFYELNLDKNTEDLNSFILKKREVDSSKETLTVITGKYKVENKKIILKPETELIQEIFPDSNQTVKENKYKGSPIRVHIQNKDMLNPIMVFKYFGKILKLAKE